MIKASEIRMGNWVEENGQPVEVDAFSYYGDLMSEDRSFDDNYRNIKDPKPITLTDEWMKKFGFVTMDYEYENIDWGREDTDLDFSISQYGIPPEEQPFIFTYDCGMGNRELVIKYVHQLQNLYFAITGNELTVKL